MRVSVEERLEIEDFLTLEARLADESRYSEWEALVDDDMVYWVPTAESAEFEPGAKTSIIYDNRSRVATRIRQLNTGKRHSQVPVSPMARMLTNIEVERTGDDSYTARCNMVVYEHRIQSTRELYTWPARVEYRLRRGDGGLKMFFKGVRLVIAAQAVPGLAFII